MRVQHTLLAAGALLASVGVANAAEPSLLTEAQLDKVIAGQNTAPPPPSFGPVGNSGNVKTPNGVHKTGQPK
jgi:hypothetical protein